MLSCRIVLDWLTHKGRWCASCEVFSVFVLEWGRRLILFVKKTRILVWTAQVLFVIPHSPYLFIVDACTGSLEKIHLADPLCFNFTKFGRTYSALPNAFLVFCRARSEGFEQSADNGRETGRPLQEVCRPARRAPGLANQIQAEPEETRWGEFCVVLCPHSLTFRNTV